MCHPLSTRMHCACMYVCCVVYACSAHSLYEYIYAHNLYMADFGFLGAGLLPIACVYVLYYTILLLYCTHPSDRANMYRCRAASHLPLFFVFLLVANKSNTSQRGLPCAAHTVLHMYKPSACTPSSAELHIFRADREKERDEKSTK